MKWIGYILLLAIIVAIFTSPSENKFRDFIYTRMDTTICKPFVSHKSYGVGPVHFFSINTARECKRVNHIESVKILKNAGVAVLGKEENYLGLFGKFWKL